MLSLKQSTMKIKKRWFRNWYVAEYGRGYSIQYYVLHWDEALNCKGKSLQGPFIFPTATRKCKEMNDDNDWAMFQP